jgi:hypothetical protein
MSFTGRKMLGQYCLALIGLYNTCTIGWSVISISDGVGGKVKYSMTISTCYAIIQMSNHNVPPVTVIHLIIQLTRNTKHSV